MNQPQPSSASLPVNEDEEQRSTAPVDAPLGEKPPAQDADRATAALSDTDEEGAEGEGEQFDEDDDDDEAGRDERNSRRPPRGPVEPPAPPVSFADVVSGQFDQQADAAEASTLKRVLAPQPETPKLHKVLAQAGLGSRVGMGELIMEWRI